MKNNSSSTTTAVPAPTTARCRENTFITATGSPVTNPKKPRSFSWSNISPKLLTSSQIQKSSISAAASEPAVSTSPASIKRKPSASPSLRGKSKWPTRLPRRPAFSASFPCTDAETLDTQSNGFAQPLDVLWSIESISHYQDVPRFFARASTLLKSGGTLVLTNWFKRKSLSPHEHQRFLHPMLVELHSMRDYHKYLAATGLQVTRSSLLNQHTAKTWDFCLDIIKDKALWQPLPNTAPTLSAFSGASRPCAQDSPPATSSTALSSLANPPFRIRIV
jgi:hypothetical protein